VRHRANYSGTGPDGRLRRSFRTSAQRNEVSDFIFAVSRSGARGRNRTRDIFITSEVLYQLSYSGGKTILGRLAAPQEKVGGLVVDGAVMDGVLVDWHYSSVNAARRSRDPSARSGGLLPMTTSVSPIDEVLLRDRANSPEDVPVEIKRISITCRGPVRMQN
jgi:hypothetical protein